MVTNVIKCFPAFESYITSPPVLSCEEMFEDEGVCVVEWPIYIQDILPQERLDITITKNDDESRTFAFQANGAQYQNIVEELKL